MSVTARIAAFALALALLFGAAALAGAALDPGVDERGDEHEAGASAINEHGMTSAAMAVAPGLAAEEEGYRLVPERTRLPSSADVTYRFRILSPVGETVDDFDLEHERRMHLIVIRRDFASFQHLHPRQLGDGSWEAEADMSEGGIYRAFADFSTAGTSLTLGADLFVAGRFNPQPLPAPAIEADAGDGYEVAIESNTPISGGTTAVAFSVTRDGRPLDSVEPYLGADGHLVALREHDQAFLHTHPEGEPGGPGPIEFGVEYPSAGRYRLFVQFKHQGEVRTAAFTQRVGNAPMPEEEAHDDD